MEFFSHLKTHWRLLNFLGWLIILAYLSYMTVQFQTYSWWVVKWHTHLALPFILFMTGVLVIEGWETLFGVSLSGAMKGWFFLCWLLGAVELLLMATGVGVLLGDKPWGYYIGTDFIPMKDSPYHTWSPGIKVHIEKEEFTYARKINSLGFADHEWNAQKPDSTYRVLCLGDSFTEGDGVKYEESYVAQLRKLWHLEKGKTVEIMNAGVCGSDPFFTFKLYLDKLNKFQPDLIIQTISSHDIIQDISLRGGMDRFNAKNGIYRPDFKLWQVFFVCNYSFRILIKASHKVANATKYLHASKNSPSIDSEIISLFDHWNKMAEMKKTVLFVVFLPGRAEMERKSYFHQMDDLKRELSLRGINLVDLYDCYEERSGKGQKIRQFFWITDGHHNAKGYRMMSECIYKGLKEKRLAE